jgi:cysteine desulfurase/selenocysteine lyase
MDHFGIAATARASLGMYNTTDDIDALVHALGKVQELFG